MKLIAGGDSFVWGSELADSPHGGANGYSQCTFSALLAKQYDMDYICAAHPGNANNAITRMTLAEITQQRQQNNQIAVMITWTFTQRFEFRFTHYTGQKITPWCSINSWNLEEDIRSIFKSLRDGDPKIVADQIKHFNRAKDLGISDFAKIFYMHVGNSEYFELYSTLKEIVFMQNYLELYNIPYLFLSADIVIKDSDNYIRSQDQYINDLYGQIKWDKWYFFPPGTEPCHTKNPRGFYQWAIENKYKVGVTHPLEDAHRDAAELIKEKFNELVNKNI
jgi:hypothetical protein